MKISKPRKLRGHAERKHMNWKNKYDMLICLFPFIFCITIAFNHQIRSTTVYTWCIWLIVTALSLLILIGAVDYFYYHFLLYLHKKRGGD